MSIFGKFERKVEGAVSGVFARAFKGDVQPVEIAARLQRELDAEAKLMSRDKRLVPNEFIVGLSEHDHDKLTPYSKTLTAELAAELQDPRPRHGLHVQRTDPDPLRPEHVVADRPVHRRLRGRRGHDAGRRSSAADPPVPPLRPVGSSASPPRPRHRPSRPALVGAPRPTAPRRARAPCRARATVRVRPVPQSASDNMFRPTSVVRSWCSRSTASATRSSRPASSSAAAPTRTCGSTTRASPGCTPRSGSATRRSGAVEIVDLGSTNGITVNGQKVRQATLTEGTRIEIGSTRMLVHAPSGR